MNQIPPTAQLSLLVHLVNTLWLLRECSGFVHQVPCSSSISFSASQTSTTINHGAVVSRLHASENEPYTSQCLSPTHPAEIAELNLFRAPWTELPGYQTVLTIDQEDEPHYYDMFLQMLSEQQQQQQSSTPPTHLFYGHVYLYQGSTNLGNPAYNLPERLSNGTTTSVDPDWCPLIGTLMRITDIQLVTTGPTNAIRMVVQGIGRFQIRHALQQMPYAKASVTRVVDEECWKPLCGMPISTNNQPKHHAFLAQPVDTTSPSHNSNCYMDLEMAMIQAATAAAMAQEQALESLEFRPVTLPKQEEHSNTPSSLSSPVQVSPLCNFHLDPTSSSSSSTRIDFRQLRQDMELVYSNHLKHQGDFLGSDEVLMAATMFPMGSAASSIQDEETTTLLLLWEAKVWTQLQELLRRLARTGARVPIPSQLLGLLPPPVIESTKSSTTTTSIYDRDRTAYDDNDNLDWNELERQAQQFEEQQASIGTYSQSPFVRVAHAVPEYPAVRRASRFSFVIWIILATVSFDNQGASREEILQMSSAQERLGEAHRQLVRLNKALESMV